VSEGAVFASATEVESANIVRVAFILLAVHSSIHVDIGIVCALASLLLVSSTSLETSTASALGLDTVEK
jgi:hypothetical protein